MDDWYKEWKKAKPFLPRKQRTKILIVDILIWTAAVLLFFYFLSRPFRHMSLYICFEFYLAGILSRSHRKSCLQALAEDSCDTFADACTTEAEKIEARKLAKKEHRRVVLYDILIWSAVVVLHILHRIIARLFDLYNGKPHDIILLLWVLIPGGFALSKHHRTRLEQERLKRKLEAEHRRLRELEEEA